MITELEKHWNRIAEDGPRRVLIDADGTAVKPNLAGFDPTAIFIRKDGWSLGATAELENHARALWEDEWIGVARMINGEWILEGLE